MDRRAVITGMGAITPLGNDLQTTWQGIVSGQSGIDCLTLFDASAFPVKIAGEVKDFSFDAADFFSDFHLFEGRSTRFCLEASRMAIEDSGIDLNREDINRIGISLGGDEEYMPLRLFEEIYDRNYILRAVEEGQDALAELFEHSSLLAKAWSFRRRTDMGAKHLCLAYNLRGPVETSHTACASSGHAIGKAKRLIENSDCDLVITGGHCSMISEFVVAGFYLLGTLSTNNGQPQKASRPFDLNRDGFIIGEGSGIVILEEVDHAKKRGARVYAELTGYGSSSNAYRLTDSPPGGRGGAVAIQRCLEDAKTDASRVDYINAHGTGTLLNDPSETQSIKRVFGDRAYKIPVSSSKSMIGHLVCSSSAVELIITIMAIKENLVPPTINMETPDPKCDLDYVPNMAREKKINAAISNSFAFGGQNATLAVEKFRG